MSDSIFTNMFSSEASDSFVDVILSHFESKGMGVKGLLVDKSFQSSVKSAKAWAKENGFQGLTRHSILEDSYVLLSKDFSEDEIGEETVAIRKGVRAFVSAPQEAEEDAAEEVVEFPDAELVVPDTLISNFVEQQSFDLVNPEHSDDPLVFTVRAAIPGTVGTSPDGKFQVVYNAEALINTELSEFTILNINHNPNAVIGELVGMQIERTELRPELIVSFRVFEPFAYLADIIRSNKYDGFSIETAVFEFNRTDVPNVFEALSMELTGLALLLAVPPACPKEVCHLLSSAFPTLTFEDEVQADEAIFAELGEATPEQLEQLLAMVQDEVQQRTL